MQKREAYERAKMALVMAAVNYGSAVKAFATAPTEANGEALELQLGNVKSAAISLHRALHPNVRKEVISTNK